MVVTPCSPALHGQDQAIVTTKGHLKHWEPSTGRSEEQGAQTRPTRPLLNHRKNLFPAPDGDHIVP